MTFKIKSLRNHFCNLFTVVSLSQIIRQSSLNLGCSLTVVDLAGRDIIQWFLYIWKWVFRVNGVYHVWGETCWVIKEETQQGGILMLIYKNGISALFCFSCDVRPLWTMCLCLCVFHLSLSTGCTFSSSLTCSKWPQVKPLLIKARRRIKAGGEKQFGQVGSTREQPDLDGCVCVLWVRILRISLVW